MVNNYIEINVKGKWVKVPALAIDGVHVILRGKWVKVAVVHDEAWLVDELKDPVTLIECLKNEKMGLLKADILAFSQKLPAINPKYSYPMERDSVAAIHVTSFKDWWEGKLPQETRKNVRRSQKRGVVVKVKQLDDDLINEIVEQSYDSPIRQGVPFAHFGKSVETVRRDQAAFLDRSDYICAYIGTELIGFLKLVYRGHIASILNLLPKASRSDARPANALIAKAVEVCEQKGVKYLTYGKFRYGNQGHTSLMEFKIRNGFEEMFVPKYYIPLTFKGRVAKLFKLHHELVEIFPESAIEVGRYLRAKWYKVKVAVSARNSTPV